MTCPAVSDAPLGWPAGAPSSTCARSARPARGELSAEAVAGYIAKYATKATESYGAALDRRNHHEHELDHLRVPAHIARLARACWTLGGEPALTGLRLRQWAHMLGFRGHWSTKSRRYSTTLTALRRARAAHAEAQRRNGAIPLDAWRRPMTDQAVAVVKEWGYAGTGHRTAGDAWLAASAAARAREHRRIAREEHHGGRPLLDRLIVLEGVTWPTSKRTRNGKPAYVARYLDPEGQERSRSFRTEREAERFLIQIEAAKLNDDNYLDPAARRLTFNQWADQWWQIWAADPDRSPPSRLRTADSAVTCARASGGAGSARSQRPRSASGSTSCVVRSWSTQPSWRAARC